MKRRSVLIVLVTAAFVTACVSMRPLPQRARELRGVWVATVNNGDWPSRKDLTVEQQKQELTAMFDRFAAMHLNAVFLQVRPMADAIYPSQYEPWSEFMYGTRGKGPDVADFDPLAFAITEAHKRGLELHAWFNPYRAHRANGDVGAQVVKNNPDHVHDYGRFVWMDPGSEQVRRDAMTVIADVTKRYDVDGIHVDDYFYPYPEKDAAGKEVDFPDDATWNAYRASGGTLPRDEWRRQNINAFVHEMYTTVKAIKPNVEVSVSPFGIWRPGNPKQIQGFDAYAKIYADSKLWLQSGWVDFLAPQLYWPIDKKEQSFPALLKWWTKHDTLSKGIVPGIAVYRVASGRPNAVTADEIARQLEIVRNDPRATGFILFSAKSLVQDRGGVGTVVARAMEKRPRSGDPVAAR